MVAGLPICASAHAQCSCKLFPLGNSSQSRRLCPLGTTCVFIIRCMMASCLIRTRRLLVKVCDAYNNWWSPHPCSAVPLLLHKPFFFFFFTNNYPPLCLERILMSSEGNPHIARLLIASGPSTKGSALSVTICPTVAA